MNIHRNYQRNLTRVFSVCSETRSDSKYRFRIAVEKFSALALSILFRSLTHGYGFQNTRCPAVGNSRPIYTKSRNTSFTLCKNTRKLFRTLKRFQTLLCLLWAETRGNRRMSDNSPRTIPPQYLDNSPPISGQFAPEEENDKTTAYKIVFCQFDRNHAFSKMQFIDRSSIA